MGYDIRLKCKHCNSSLFESNHTSNTYRMWQKHGFDFEDWHNKSATQIMEPLQKVLDLFISNGKDYYSECCPGNEWGTYESTVNWFLSIRDACIVNLEAIVDVNA